jgi:GDP-D-mannose dehydratase
MYFATKLLSDTDSNFLAMTLIEWWYMVHGCRDSGTVTTRAIETIKHESENLKQIRYQCKDRSENEQLVGQEVSKISSSVMRIENYDRRLRGEKREAI